ncbi:MAG: NUDIX hydrolase [Chloroflexota bacterium]|nr:NUDIX hydrolase [Chloroflexota bacterium]
MKSDTVISSSRAFQGRAVSLRVDTVRRNDGNETTREIVEHDDCVAIVVLDDTENVVLVRQLRHPTGRCLLEIPAGGIESGETPADAVRRELQEEIGCLPQNLEHLGGFYPAPGYCTEYLYLYLATELIPSRLLAEDTDEIEVVRVSTSEIPKMIASGEICDAKSVAGLLRFLCERGC